MQVQGVANHNHRLFNSCFETSRYQTTNQREIEKSQHLFTKAAAKVLGNLHTYQSGKKAVDKDQIQKISSKFKRLEKGHEKKAKIKELLMSHFSNELMARLSSLREGVFLASKSHYVSSVMDNYYQIMGCFVSYIDLNPGDHIPGVPGQSSGYIVNKVIRNSQGLNITVLIPEDKSSPPILSCRGTVIHNLHNYLDDLHHNIGNYSFEKSKEEILSTLKAITEEYGPAIVTGHSLGGALTQIITTKFCDQVNAHGQPLIQMAYHFNSPGIGHKLVKEYKSKIENLPPEKKPMVLHYSHANDLAHYVGGGHIKSDKVVRVGKFTLKNTLKPIKTTLKAHSLSRLIIELEQADKTTQADHFLSAGRRITRFAEKTRLFFAVIFRAAIKRYLNHVENSIKRGSDFKAYLFMKRQVERANI